MKKEFLAERAVSVALLFIVLELTYVNSKSLYFLLGGGGIVDRIFAVIGAIACSMVTVIIMRKSSEKWLKIAYPLFDVVLAFNSFNLIDSDMSSGYYRFSLIVFMSLFVGLTTYSLGKINKIDHEVDRLESTQIDSHQDLYCNADLSDLVANAIRHEATIVRKKLESNRTAHDNRVLEFVERLKQGESISSEEYFLSKNAA